MNEKAIADTPLKRMGQPGDIATVVRFLLSDESAFVTGSDYLSDGGLTL
jgi:NAD(P)-dependent dehydrogenase (short-subunit alcohol dehydrogenase family)